MEIPPDVIIAMFLDLFEEGAMVFVAKEDGTPITILTGIPRTNNQHRDSR